VDGDQGVGMVHVALDGGGVQAACALVLNGHSAGLQQVQQRETKKQAVL